MAGGLRHVAGLLLFALGLMLYGQAAYASATAHGEHLTVAFMAPAEVAAGGGDILVGFKLTPARGWHIYWINPGETGLAAAVTWVLPTGVTAGALQWPTPERFSYAGVTTYGYARESILLARLHNRSGLKAGAGLALKAHLDILVCEKSCVPESLDLSLELKVSAARAARDDPALMAALAALPQPLNIQASISRRNGFIEMGFAAPLESLGNPRGFYAFLMDEGIVDPAAPQILTRSGQGFSLQVKALGGRLPAELPAVLKFTDGKAWKVNLKAGPRPAGTRINSSFAALVLALAAAFAGGLILNLMPCVFPILSLKLLALTRAGHDAATARIDALLYGAGALSGFLALSLALNLARDLGASLGWGFQLQSPFVTGLLSLLLLAVALNMSGLFEVGSGLQSRGGALLAGVANKPRLSAVLTGVLAVVIAAPCSAPFMAAAMGLALAQGGLVSLLIFTGLALGFAAPFVGLTFAITLVPALARRLPRPGIWMDRLRRFLALPMYASAFWMLWVFAQQVSPAANPGASIAGYEGFSPARIAALRAGNRPVLVDLTAAWCVTCKVNERFVLADARVERALKESGTIHMVGDWTHRDGVISDYLRRFGRSGVPLYVYYGAHNADPLILPQILQRDDLILLLTGHS